MGLGRAWGSKGLVEGVVLLERTVQLRGRSEGYRKPGVLIMRGNTLDVNDEGTKRRWMEGKEEEGSQAGKEGNNISLTGEARGNREFWAEYLRP